MKHFPSVKDFLEFRTVSFVSCTMSDQDISAFGLDDLREEIRRLHQELTETNQEKVRAAEYGLAVLEERNQFESQIEELEASIHSLRIELEQAKEVCFISVW